MIIFNVIIMGFTVIFRLGLGINEILTWAIVSSISTNRWKCGNKRQSGNLVTEKKFVKKFKKKIREIFLNFLKIFKIYKMPSSKMPSTKNSWNFGEGIWWGHFAKWAFPRGHFGFEEILLRIFGRAFSCEGIFGEGILCEGIFGEGILCEGIFGRANAGYTL